MSIPDTDLRGQVPKADVAFFVKLSEACGRSFVKAAEQARVALSEKDYDRWVALGKKISRSFPEEADLARGYFDASRPFFGEEGAGYLKTWGNACIRIGRRSPRCAQAFLAATPAFLEHARFPKIHQLAADAIRILDFKNAGEDTVAAFLERSGPILRYLSPRVYSIWKETGCRIARHSGDTATLYFSSDPEGLDRFSLSEITKILKITGIAASREPGRAVAFYQTAPGLVRRINPNLRDAILEKIIDLSAANPEKIIATFDDMAGPLLSFSNPVQETIVRLDQPLAEMSEAACRAYYQNIAAVLTEIPAVFLENWVSQGVAILTGNPDDGLDYFNLNTPAANAALIKWKNAAFLENNREMLGLFCLALCGQKIRIRNRQEMPPEEENRLGLIAEENGFRFYLAPYVAEEDSAAANIRFYKVAVALKAGYLEFGTLDPQFAGIWSLLESFPDKELALEIFHILEDGRIFYHLKNHYPGLAPDIDRVIEKTMARRAVPDGGLLGIALELLVRLALAHPIDIAVPAALTAAAAFLKEQLANFHAPGTTVLDSYKATTLIYDALSGFARRKSAQPIAPLSLRMSEKTEGPQGDRLDNLPPDKIVEADMPAEGEDISLTPEELERLLDMTQDMTLLSSLGFTPSAQKFYLSDLDDFTVKGEGDSQAEDPGQGDKQQRIKSGRAVTGRRAEKKRHYYDEWDYLAEEYRPRWCRLQEKETPQSDPDLYHRIYAEYSDLIRKVRFQFQRIRPASLDIIHHVDQGDEIDLTALIRSVIDKKAGVTPSDRVFCRKDKKVRHMSTLLLIDMSASTKDKAADVAAPDKSAPEEATPAAAAPGRAVTAKPEESADDKRVIDIEKESLIVMSEALDALGDQYAMYGFSGRGRKNVDYYVIKAFEEANSEQVKMKICGLEPKQSTRMGPAIRHAASQLSHLEADHRLLILLSDGFPQDHDYGEDRNSREYGIKDTMMAFIEAKRLGIKPFCITIDQAGNDYLKKMCAPEEYLIIKDIAMLPELLPGIVESLMG